MSSYFQSKKSSELEELKMELNSLKLEERKEAVKQVIAMMTIGKDVSMLFPHVIKCIKTTSIELKKLVYLYIINYAKSKPDLTLMAVNAFTQDAHEKSNPLIRALAVRTMGWIRIEKITEYLCESLKDCLIDDDPYVKKTAALSVAKIYHITPSHTKEYGFIKLLQGLLQDGNAIVVANAAAALYEISKEAGKNYIKTSKETIGKLLNALNETNEWGKVYILESIINYKPKENKEAAEIIERISPFLQHANPAVVLGSTKNILHFLEFIEDESNKNVLLKKLAAPLVTLLASEPEIQYVAILNIQNILQQIPNVFEKNVKMFFCRFSDPIYVKLAKIDVMIWVADTTNVDLIISELHEYCNDIDQDFVRRSIRAIGQVVCKVDRVAKKGIDALREHITHEGGPESALQEAIIAVSKILRKYPKKHETLLKDICAQMKRIDEPESKAAFIWIIGEFADKIEGVDKMIQYFVDSFFDQTTHVCLQILTAACKMYIKKPDDCEELVMKVLHLASEESDNPDLRDRGYIYWRMLSTDPSTAKEVILIKRPDYTENLSNLMSGEAKEIFWDAVGIVKKETPLLAGEVAELKGDEEEVKAEDEIEEIEKEPEEKKTKKDKTKKEKKKKKEAETEAEKEEEVITTKKTTTDIDDILGLGFSDEPKHKQDAISDPLADIFGPSNGSGIGGSSVPSWDDNDIFGGSSTTTSSSVSGASTFIKPKSTEVLASNSAGQSGMSGLKINGRFYRDSSQIKLELEITNTTSSIVSDFEILFNKNSFGVSPGTINVIPISGGKTFTSTINWSINSGNADQKNPPSCPYMIQTALKWSLDVFYFLIPCQLHVLLNPEEVKVTQIQCQQMMKSISNKSQKSIQSVRFSNSPEDIAKRFKANSYYFVYEESGNSVYATTTVNNVPILVISSISGSYIKTETYSPVGLVYPLVEESLETILKN